MANATPQAASGDFARVTLAVMRDGPPSCGENLDGMALDVDPRLALKSKPTRVHIA